MSFLRNTLRQDAYWALNKVFVTELGLEAAVILTVLIDRYYYYQDTGQLIQNKGEPWFYYTSEKIEEDFKIGYKVQKRIFTDLKKSNLIRSRAFGVPCKLHFGINELQIYQLLNTSITQTAILDFTKSENWINPDGNTLNNNIVNKPISTNIPSTPNGAEGSAAKKVVKAGKGKAPQVAAAPPEQNGSYFDGKPGQEPGINAGDSNTPPEGDSAAEGFKKPQTLFQQIIEKYDTWFKDGNDGQPPKIDGQQANAAKAIITYLKKVVKAKIELTKDGSDLESNVLEAWALILDNWKILEPFYQKRTKLSEINSDLQNILKQLKEHNKNGNIKKAGNGNTTATSKGVDDAVKRRFGATGGA